MGKFAEAIRDRRKSRQRRLGFGAAADPRPPELLLGTIGVVDGADFCLAPTESDAEAAASADVLWGAQTSVLTPERVAAAKAQGAAFISFTLDDARADAMLDEDMDYVLRLLDVPVDESEARALGSLRPALIEITLRELPLSLRDVIGLRRLSMLAASPLGAICSPDISASDIQALRDSGVAALVLSAGASPDDVTAVHGRIADLPERKTRRDEDAAPLIPTARSATDVADEG